MEHRRHINEVHLKKKTDAHKQCVTGTWGLNSNIEFYVYTMDFSKKTIVCSEFNYRHNMELFDELREGAKVINITNPSQADDSIARPYLEIINEREDYRVRQPTYWSGKKQKTMQTPKRRKWDFVETKTSKSRKGPVTKSAKMSTREQGYIKAHKNDDLRKKKLYDRVIIIVHPAGSGPLSSAPRILSTYKSPYDDPPYMHGVKKIKDQIKKGYFY